MLSSKALRLDVLMSLFGDTPPESIQSIYGDVGEAILLRGDVHYVFGFPDFEVRLDGTGHFRFYLRPKSRSIPFNDLEEIYLLMRKLREGLPDTFAVPFGGLPPSPIQPLVAHLPEHALICSGWTFGWPDPRKGYLAKMMKSAPLKFRVRYADFPWEACVRLHLDSEAFYPYFALKIVYDRSRLVHAAQKDALDFYLKGDWVFKPEGDDEGYDMPVQLCDVQTVSFHSPLLGV
jgi:hypothetical protein